MAALRPEQARLALVAVTNAAVTEASQLVSQNAAQTRQALFDVIPSTIAYYSDGSSALAADYYDDLRQDASAAGRFRADPVVNLRWGGQGEEKIRTGILWAVAPLLDEVPDQALSVSRVGDVVQLETARPFRDTITTNRRRDPSAVGWQRVAAGGCKFCRFLAGRGEVYRESSARFASHPHCRCTAVPVFHEHQGDEVDVLKYVASKRRASRTPKQRQEIRELLASMP
jgi:hypothetical protein